MRVMMSAAGSTVAPGIIRHLQNLGHYVIGHDCSRFGYGMDIVDEAHVSPRIDTDPGGYLAFVDSFNPDFDVYLPFLDEELRLPDFNIIIGVNLAQPGKTLRIFTSKVNMQGALEDAGLPVAPYAHRHPAIYKPDHGRGGKHNIRTDTLPEPGIFDLPPLGWVGQKIIYGDEYTVDVLVDRNHHFLWATSRLRLQANGVSIVGKIIEDGEILVLARRVVNAFQFVGPINIQMIRERDTGKLYIIEINPRLSGSCMFTVLAGFDILNATIRLAMGLPFEPPEDVREITVQRYYEERVV